MDNLVKEYKASLQLINNRITMLKSELDKLEKNKRISEDEKKLQANEIKDRLRSLYPIQRDLRGVHITVKNYYVRGWWRNEDYTCNQRRARRVVFYFGNFPE